MNIKFFTPGPAQLYPTVTKHINQALSEDILSMSHRGDKFHALVTDLHDSLRKLLNIPTDYQIFFVASGTEAMEMTIRNCVEKNCFHLVNGAFSKRFYEMAKDIGKEAQAEIIDERDVFKNILIPKETELICLTHNETSTGAQLPLEFIYSLKKQAPNSLLAIDTVSSMPYVDLDYSMLDIVFFSVQKCFGLPSGLGVMIVSPYALNKAKMLKEKKYDVGTYHSFNSLLKAALNFETVETPNIFDLYLLNKVTNDFLQIGITNLRKQTQDKAKMLYDFFAERPEFEIFIKTKNFQSQTTIVVNIGVEKLQMIQEMERINNIVIGRGYGRYKDQQLRIANFFAHTQEDIEKLIRGLSFN